MTMVEVALSRISVDGSNDSVVVVDDSDSRVDVAVDDGCINRVFATYLVLGENADTNTEDDALNTTLDFNRAANMIVDAAYERLESFMISFEVDCSSIFMPTMIV